MKIFIDTGDIAEIKEAHSLGAIDGVTTNPSLLAKRPEGLPREVITEICEIVDGPGPRRGAGDDDGRSCAGGASSPSCTRTWW